MTTPRDDARPTERFTERATDYARNRPSYPAGAIDCVLDGLGAPATLAAADVGAGTGIAARLLAERGVRVTGVEPNAAMREAAAPAPNLTWCDGTAERTGLADRSVDLVTAFQAFHWFRAEPAIREFLRILRPGGRVALVWNLRDETDAVTAQYTRILRAAVPDDPAIVEPTRADPNALRGTTGLRSLAPLVFAYRQSHDAAGLVGRAFSSSYMPRTGPLHDAALAALETLAANHADADGRVELAYRTFVYRADVRR